MRRLSKTTRLLTAAASLAATVAVGLALGLLGGAAASSALGKAAPKEVVLPSVHRLRSVAATLARLPTPPSTSASPETIVAQARRYRIALYHRPRGRPYRTLRPLPYSYGTRPAFRVLTLGRTWLHVSLPIRPNHSTAWIRRRDVVLAKTDYRLEVQLGRHRLLLWRGRRRLLTAPIAVGKALTPTPSGAYFVAYTLRTSDPTGFFGPYAFGLSAYSRVLTSFAGGDGEIGLHGTSEPWLLGRSVSHGCIRIRNSVIARLAHLLPLGTPSELNADQLNERRTAMPGFIGFPELIVLGLVLLLIFGPKRLPEMGRSLGHGMREFKDSITGSGREPEPPRAVEPQPEERERAA